MKLRSFILACCVLGLAACAPPPKASLFGPTKKISADEYQTILSRWTRSDRVYQGLDSKMFVTATFHAPELRRAFGVAFPEIYGHGGSITRRELVDLTGDVEQFHNFFVAVYTADEKWNDLAMPDSIWHLTLIGSEDVAVEASSIEIIRIDANLRAVYPFLGRFDRAYLVRFPLTDPMHRLVLEPKSTSANLRIASALGVASLVWELIPSAGQQTPPAASQSP